MTYDELRKKALELRARIIWHHKQGHATPKLTKAYQRMKSELMLLRRQKPTILGRSYWGAAPPRSGRSTRPRTDTIAVHHSASSKFLFGSGVRAEAAHVREIQRWHFGRGFSDIGYAWVIGPSGTIFEGRPSWAIGAHVLNYNSSSEGICLLGNFEQEAPTAGQLRSLKWLINERRRFYGRELKVRGHRDYPGHTTNACPGRNLYKRLSEVR